MNGKVFALLALTAAKRDKFVFFSSTSVSRVKTPTLLYGTTSTAVPIKTDDRLALKTLSGALKSLSHGGTDGQISFFELCVFSQRYHSI